MTNYAAKTSVSTENSRAEIERTLRRYKADAFAYGVDGPHASLAFRMNGRHFRFSLVMPDRNDRAFTQHSRGSRTPGEAQKVWEQACRQRWRALALVMKAKLEAVAAGISTVEDEFLAHTVLPDNTTFGHWAKAEIEQVYLTGHMPTQLMIEGPKAR